jgi:hypothetical protein
VAAPSSAHHNRDICALSWCYKRADDVLPYLSRVEDAICSVATDVWQARPRPSTTALQPDPIRVGHDEGIHILRIDVRMSYTIPRPDAPVVSTWAMSSKCMVAAYIYIPLPTAHYHVFKGQSCRACFYTAVLYQVPVPVALKLL